MERNFFISVENNPRVSCSVVRLPWIIVEATVPMWAVLCLKCACARNPQPVTSPRVQGLGVVNGRVTAGTAQPIQPIINPPACSALFQNQYPMNPGNIVKVLRQYVVTVLLHASIN